MPMKWEAGHITSEEQILVNKLRDEVRDKLTFGEHHQTKEDQDLFLVRWLRARELDLDKAKNMLLNSLKWREQNDFANCLTKPVDPLLKEEYVYEFPGVDNDGHPILLMVLRKFDIRLVIDNKKFDEFDHFICVYFGSIMEQIRYRNANRKPEQLPITQFTLICDFKNYPYSQLLNIRAFNKILQLASVYEAHFPEVMHKALLLNCPSFMQVFLGLLKTVATKRSMDKIVTFRSMDEWKREAHNYVDIRILREEYRGSLQI